MKLRAYFNTADTVMLPLLNVLYMAQITVGERHDRIGRQKQNWKPQQRIVFQPSSSDKLYDLIENNTVSPVFKKSYSFVKAKLRSLLFHFG